MATKVGVRVFETTQTAGTGTYVLEGAVFGYQSYDDDGATNDIYFYCCEDIDVTSETGQWEFGRGTLSVGTGPGGKDELVRTEILANSDGTTSAISWPASGVRNLFSSYPAEGYMIGANNLAEITTPATARSNLGLGDAAVLNEGSGNGLDADTVDTFEGAAFVQKSVAETISGNHTFSGDSTFSGDNSLSGVNTWSGAGRLVLPVGVDLYDTT
jgi:hypothetical protein